MQLDFGGNDAKWGASIKVKLGAVESRGQDSFGREVLREVISESNRADPRIF
jgi:hypothetical protein